MPILGMFILILGINMPGVRAMASGFQARLVFDAVAYDSTLAQQGGKVDGELLVIRNQPRRRPPDPSPASPAGKWFQERFIDAQVFGHGLVNSPTIADHLGFRHKGFKSLPSAAQSLQSGDPAQCQLPDHRTNDFCARQHLRANVATPRG